jgi:parallel beta-helix repeat protein
VEKGELFRKTASEILLFLLLASTLSLMVNIQSVRAIEEVYIRADGSVYPPTVPIATTDNITYTLTDDINGSIVIALDGIIIDGASHVLEGTGIGSEYGTFTVGVLLTGRSNVTIKNMIIEAFDYGIRLEYSIINNLAGNKIINDLDAIFLADSSNNTAFGNNVTNNLEGISLGNSSGNTICGNTITNTVELGVSLYSSSDNSISKNIITNNKNGIALYSSSNNSISENNIMNSSDEGILLGDFSDNNDLFGNNVTRSYNIGIWLYSSSSYNSIFENILTDNRYGMRFDSSNNKIFHNNFVNNSCQVFSYYSANVWDDGYSSGGNYWSDYNGTDLYSGPHQNITGSEGIGDTPYVTDANNTDYYPLVHAPQVVYNPSDVNNDGIVNMKDVMTVIHAFNSFPQQPRWDPKCDLNHDNRIDMHDILTVVLNFGKSI